MKNRYTLFVILFVGIFAKAQIVNIPDANFKAKLLAASPNNYIASTEVYSPSTPLIYSTIDTNNDGEIQTSEALSIKWLNVHSSYIADLTGIESFTNLKQLDCSLNQIQSLNLSSLINLEVIGCSHNQITNLNVNGLTNLQFLRCVGNQLTNLDVSGLTNLLTLICFGNQLTSINLNGLTNLSSLDCSVNQLTSLDLSDLSNLATFYCYQNQLSSLDLTPFSNLGSLYCFSNQITTLDLTNSTNLGTLDCMDNQLVSLFIKNGRNQSVNFAGNPNLQYICADAGEISIIQYMLEMDGYTNCHVNSYCSFTPGGTVYSIQGDIRYDGDNNGCSANDLIFPNFKCSISDGTNTGTFISNNSGSYSFSVQAGTHIMTPLLENPSYFNVSPTTASVTFPTVTSPFTQDFCITANGVHPDLEVAVMPIDPARPGFDAWYKITYKNKGTQTQSGTVNLAFMDSILDVVSATPAVTSQATNNLSWNFTNLVPFETRQIYLELNVNSPMETPAVNGGDVLSYTATVTGLTDETPLDNVAILNQTVVSSFDPNDKTCLEGNSITPSMVGKYLHYLIRFENTGTANAVNVVVKDIIDTNKFDVSSLISLNASHNFTTKISNGNQVEFIFQNINLPFDDANNDGYVLFKIKTRPTLVIDDSFSNTASIYFDYNFPIVTDPAVTTVRALNNPDFDFNTVFSLSPVPAKNSLTITTKQAVTMSSISIYNTLGQLVQVSTNPTETLDVSELQPGSYFLNIISDKGTATTKFIKE